MIVIIACVLFGLAHPAQADNVVVGVNIWNEGYLSKTAQDAELKQMAESGVKTIRTGLLAYNVDFIIKAYQQGIGSVVILFPFSGKKTWSDVTLSEIKPEQLTERVKPLLDKLRRQGYISSPSNLEMRSTRLPSIAIFPTRAADAN